MTVRIPLTQGKFALVDDEDADLAGRTWHAARRDRRWYAAAYHSGAQHKFIHQIVLERMLKRRLRLRPREETDHINCNGLDNRRNNLRIASSSQNHANTRPPSHNRSGIKGVSWDKHAGKWAAYIHVGGRKRHLGLFEHKQTAGLAYRAAARKVWGEYARSTSE